MRLPKILCSLAFCLVCFSYAPAFAADGTNMAVGLGVGVSNTAQDADFKSTGTPMNLYFDWNIDPDWLKFRFGYGTSKATLSYDGWSKTWEHTLSSTLLYAAWRYDYPMEDLVEGMKAEAHLGLSQVSAKMETNHGVASQSAAKLGSLLGAGVLYGIGDFGVGLQVDYHAATAKLADQSVAIGATQVQAVVTYSF